MGTKTICVHRYVMPPLKEFKKKYYFLISSLLFEYEESGYRNDVEIYGFNEAETSTLSSILPYFYVDGRLLKVEDYNFAMLEQMISILPVDMKKQLIDHIVLSSIDKAEDLRTMLLNLKSNLSNTGASLPLQDVSNLDFFEFFKGGESEFMNEYYPSEDSKDEIRLQYGIKR